MPIVPVKQIRVGKQLNDEETIKIFGELHRNFHPCLNYVLL